MKSIILYGTKDCPWCERVNHLLEDLNIKKIKFLDVQKDFKARTEMITKSNQYSTPVLDIAGNIIIGFDKNAIEHAIRN